MSERKRKVTAVLSLAALLAAALALRLAHADYGLPFVWNLDERTHFVNRAIPMFAGNFDPGYYQNPAAFTYLSYLSLRVLYGLFGFAFSLDWGSVPRQFSRNPTEIWLTARALAALLSVSSVALLWAFATRAFGRTVGLCAAAVLAFSFLVVSYGRIAVTDSGALIGSAAATGAALLWLKERRRWWLLVAGLAVGAACAFKYTAGLLVVPVLLASLSVRGQRIRGARTAFAGLALGALLFAAFNPFLILHFDRAWQELREQAAVAGLARKAGQDQAPLPYYLDSLGWGFGVLPALSAAVGAVVLGRRDRRMLAVTAVFPLLLLAWLALQSRAFGRWLMPAYPQLALLAGIGVAAVGAALGRAIATVGDRSGGERRRATVGVATTALVLAVALWQPLRADLHQLAVLGRADTRQQLRDWIVNSGRLELRAVIEPAVPERWYVLDPKGVPPPWLGRCRGPRAWGHDGWLVTLPNYRRCERGKPALTTRPDGALAATNYYRALFPRLIDDYRFYGYCTVITMSLVRDRARAASSAARAYYERLARESTLVKRFSPYRRGAQPVPFHFDHSYLYYPRAFERPGPEIEVRRLHNCAQRRGQPIVRLPIAPDDRPAPGDEV